MSYIETISVDSTVETWEGGCGKIIGDRRGSKHQINEYQSQFWEKDPRCSKETQLFYLLPEVSQCCTRKCQMAANSAQWKMTSQRLRTICMNQTRANSAHASESQGQEYRTGILGTLVQSRLDLLTPGLVVWSELDWFKNLEYLLDSILVQAFHWSTMSAWEITISINDTK